MFLVQEIQQEGKHAIDSPGSPLSADIPPEIYSLGKFAFFYFQAIRK